MPRRARRGAANGAGPASAAPPTACASSSACPSKPGANVDSAATSPAAARVTTLLAKVLTLLHDQRSLRLEAATVRARVSLLDGEYVTLHAEYERSLGARDRLDALSRELSRQNKAVLDEGERALREERRLREVFVSRFNAAIDDVGASLAHHGAGRERADGMRRHLAGIRGEFEERGRVRRELAEAARWTREVERRLDEARVREARGRRDVVGDELKRLRARSKSLREEEILLRARLGGAGAFTTATASAQDLLLSARRKLTDTAAHVERLSQAGRDTAASNSTLRNSNAATLVRISADEAEAARLTSAISEVRASERVERTKREALEKLCRRVTEERAGLHSEVVIMQQTWANLKGDIDGLGTQTGGARRIVEALKEILGKEYDAGGLLGAEGELDVAIRRALGNPRGDVSAPGAVVRVSREPIDHRSVPIKIRQPTTSGAASSSSRG